MYTAKYVLSFLIFLRIQISMYKLKNCDIINKRNPMLLFVMLRKFFQSNSDELAGFQKKLSTASLSVITQGLATTLHSFQNSFIATGLAQNKKKLNKMELSEHSTGVTGFDSTLNIDRQVMVRDAGTDVMESDNKNAADKKSGTSERKDQEVS